MQLLGKRSLAWVLKWLNDVAIVLFTITLVSVLVFMAIRSPRGATLPFSLDFPLPNQIVESTSGGKEVTSVVARYTSIGFQTEIDWQQEVLGFSGMVVGFGLIIWILWLIRKILVSLVAGQPLTEANARHFRSIGFLFVVSMVFDGFWRMLVYFYLQQHFQLPPSPGFFRVLSGHFELTELFKALLILLMAEVLRLGAKYRVDSETVI